MNRMKHHEGLSSGTLPVWKLISVALPDILNIFGENIIIHIFYLSFSRFWKIWDILNAKHFIAVTPLKLTQSRSKLAGTSNIHFEGQEGDITLMFHFCSPSITSIGLGVFESVLVLLYQVHTRLRLFSPFTVFPSPPRSNTAVCPRCVAASHRGSSGALIQLSWLLYPTAPKYGPQPYFLSTSTTLFTLASTVSKLHFFASP